MLLKILSASFKGWKLSRSFTGGKEQQWPPQVEWGGSRQEIEGTVRTAVGRRESGEEKDYLYFHRLGPYPQFKFWTKFLKQPSNKSPGLHELWPFCLFGMSQRKAVLCVQQPRGDAQWPRWDDWLGRAPGALPALHPPHTCTMNKQRTAFCGAPSPASLFGPSTWKLTTGLMWKRI